MNKFKVKNICNVTYKLLNATLLERILFFMASRQIPIEMKQSVEL